VTRDLYQTIAKNIMACRHMRGLSTSALAVSASIPERVLLTYEAGSGRVPASDLVRIIEACDVPVGRMFARADVPLQRPRDAVPAHRTS
jgi:hypothetical protein